MGTWQGALASASENVPPDSLDYQGRPSRALCPIRFTRRYQAQFLTLHLHSHSCGICFPPAPSWTVSFWLWLGFWFSNFYTSVFPAGIFPYQAVSLMRFTKNGKSPTASLKLWSLINIIVLPLFLIGSLYFKLKESILVTAIPWAITMKSSPSFTYIFKVYPHNSLRICHLYLTARYWVTMMSWVLF